jgi:sortase system peptidoglycan-associated protein
MPSGFRSITLLPQFTRINTHTTPQDASFAPLNKPHALILRISPQTRGKKMKLKPIIAAIAIAGCSQATLAAEPTAEPAIERQRSATTGLVIGAIAAGPAGAFAGAVLGGEVVGRFFETRRINKHLINEVGQLRNDIDEERRQYETTVAALNQDLDKLLVLQTASTKNQRLPIQFRTASSEIEVQYDKELSDIARVLRRNKDATVTLTGFSDRRGDDGYNQQLSEKRVRSIQQDLLQRGVDNNQIITMAYGESRPLNETESLESNFFDRRVVLELNTDIDPQLATR